MSQSLAVVTHTPAFLAGFAEGLTGIARENCERISACPVDEEDVISVISNLADIAKEGWLSQDQLRHDAGLLAGWICRAERRSRGCL